MKRFLLCLLAVLILFPFLAPGQSFSSVPGLKPGVSYELATYRKGVLRDVAYQLEFRVPADKRATVVAYESISFELSHNLVPLQLDFKEQISFLDSLEVNGKMVALVHAQEHVLIAPGWLRRGANVVRVWFRAGDLSLNRNADFLYTLLVPDRARSLFPCFDQPDLKAVFTLSLTLPAGWKAIGNGPLKDTVAVDVGHTTWHFFPSDTIPTYLFAFVAGRFSEAVGKPGGRAMHFLYRETDSTKIRLSMEPVFHIQQQALDFLSDYTGIAFPFKKFDFAGIPDFQFGGMEHVGAIEYQAGSLFLDSSATRDQLIARSNLLSHETSHMWFGNLVTMRWFNDVWMKEVFANLMADKIGLVTLPDGNAGLKFLTAHYPAAYGIDRTGGAHPIRQQLDNLQDAGSLYGNIIYHKAPVMMRQLELLMGAEAFRAGLRDYLKRFSFGNASWPDLIGILDAHTPADLQAWNKVWVNEWGRPKFSYGMETANGKIRLLKLTQQGEDGSKRVWPQLFSIALVYADYVDTIVVRMKGASVVLTAAAGKPKPRFILFNSDGQGYGLFPVDEASLPVIAALKDPVMRAAAYINLYEHMLNGQVVTPQQLLHLELGALVVEPEELVLSLMLDHVQAVYWRLTAPDKRAAMAREVEDAIWGAMVDAPTANEKRLLFKAYMGVTLSKGAQDHLYACWKNMQPPAGVKLSEDDYTNLATGLALRAYPGYSNILEEQLGRITNADRKERLLFLLPALSDSLVVRDAFFASLKEAKNRQKEAWVLTALSFLHHPLRVRMSEKYLPESLALVEEIQRTGDIFFPQNWLQASLGNYQTASAAGVVRAFLQVHPGYNPKLRAKVLQAADGVFRAEKLVR